MKNICLVFLCLISFSLSANDENIRKCEESEFKFRNYFNAKEYNKKVEVIKEYVTWRPLDLLFDGSYELLYYGLEVVDKKLSPTSLTLILRRAKDKALIFERDYKLKNEEDALVQEGMKLSDLPQDDASLPSTLKLIVKSNGKAICAVSQEYPERHTIE